MSSAKAQDRGRSEKWEDGRHEVIPAHRMIDVILFARSSLLLKRPAETLVRQSDSVFHPTGVSEDFILDTREQIQPMTIAKTLKPAWRYFFLPGCPQERLDRRRHNSGLKAGVTTA